MSLIDNSYENAEDQNANRNIGIKFILIRFQVDIKALFRLQWRPDVLIIMKNMSEFCPCPETLWQAMFRDQWLLYLLEEMSKAFSLQAMAKVLSAFSLLFSENWK